MDAKLKDFPEDRESLEAIVRALILDASNRGSGPNKRVSGRMISTLTSEDVAQALLEFAEQLEAKPIPAEDVPAKAEPEHELRRVKRRPGRRHLANFENLPVTTQVYELSPEERICPGCGVERKEIGGDESWQVEYIPGRFERIQHLRKKYACAGCEKAGENPQMEMAAKPEAAIEKGMAGPGLLAYIVTRKFSDYLPLYRLEDIF